VFFGWRFGRGGEGARADVSDGGAEAQGEDLCGVSREVYAIGFLVDGRVAWLLAMTRWGALDGICPEE
jgi:hypothetical protein